MLIKELVKLDTQGKFISAVQLSDYDNPQDNLSLVKSYIFASNAPDTRIGQAREVGSVDLLRDLRLSYTNTSSNRFVVIANYGHGKSHFGLVLANFFAKPYRSTEVQEILGRIGHTLQHNQPEVENFHDFKRQYDRFLVIRLRGDTPRSLREQFFPALKCSLQEHPDTANAELPFWNQQAKQWLQSKQSDQQARQFLKEQFSIDFPNLLQDVEENKQEAYEQYVQLFSHLNNGVTPNAEGNFSLREAIIWVVDNFCQNAKPLAGVVVLFDEFSQFIERYSQSKAIGELQQMLEGVGDRRGQAMFLAFAQHDPDEVAERRQGGQSLQDIKRELGRIDRKYALYSLMESVLSAYLAQSESNWECFLQDNPRIKGGLYGQTTEFVWELYHRRYDKELRWTNDKFRTVVTKGCFPLHPLTTALLCHLKMQQGLDDDARTILKFVRNQFELKQNDSAMRDDKINWILPIDLTDYFGSRIAKQQDFDAYEIATQNLEQVYGDQLFQEQKNVLKSLLLQMADGLQHVAGERQVEMISHMAGLDYKNTLRILKDLGKSNIIKYDENTRYNSFWPVSANPKALEQKIREQIVEKKFEDDELFELNSVLDELIPGASRIEVGIPWGTSLDWAATSAIVTKEKFNAEYLQSLMKPYKLNFQGLQDGNRGLVIWLMALDDSDIQFFNQNTVQQMLQEAFPNETPPPILAVLPLQSHKNLSDQLIRYRALKLIGKDKEAIKEIGQITYDTELGRNKKYLKKELGVLLRDEDKFASLPHRPQTIIVSTQYKASLLTLGAISIQSVLKKLYELAYPYRPPEFFTDLNANPKKGASPIRDAVKTVAKNLIFNRLSTALPGMNSLAQERVCRQNLVAKWHLLSTTYYVQEPDVLSLKHAWDYLDDKIQADEQEIYVKDFIPNLLNSPFGFDYNTATLLLTAWIGKHNNELHFYAKSKRVGPDYLEKLLEQGTLQDFLSKLCVTENLAISRRDSDKALTEGRNLVESVQKGVARSQIETESDINALNEVIAQGICPEDEKEVFTQAILDLQSGLETAKQYDKSAKKLLESVAGEYDIRKLLGVKQDIKRLGEIVLVLSAQPPIIEIQEKLKQQIKQAVDLICSKAENLTRIEGADSARNSLKECHELLQSDGQLDLVQVALKAEARLDERIKSLKAKEAEKALINQINSITTSATLSELYEYRKNLKQMPDGSSKFTEYRNKKLSDVEREISRLESFASDAVEKSQTVKREQANSLYEKIVGSSERFYGTEFERILLQSKQYLQNFREFENRLKTSENRMRYLHSEAEAQDLQESLEQLDQEYSPLLGENHIVLLSEICQSVKSKVYAEYLKSEQAINAIEIELEKPFIKFNELRTKLNQVSGFINPDLAKKLEILREKLSQKEAEYQRIKNEKAEQENLARIKMQEEKAKLNQINSMNPSGAGLATLYVYAENLKAITDASPAIVNIRSQKIRAIDAEISQLETFVTNIKKEYSNLSHERVETLLNEIKNRGWRFEDTKYAVSINQVRQYIEKLLDFFGEIKRVDAILIQSPDDLSHVQSVLDQIAQNYEGEIIDNYTSYLDKARQNAEKQALVAYSKAEKNIKSLEAELTDGKITQLQEKINKFTGYITPELSARIETLRAKLEEKRVEIEMAHIEKEARDTIERIEKLYLSITDPKKRQECLERLQKLH